MAFVSHNLIKREAGRAGLGTDTDTSWMLSVLHTVNRFKLVSSIFPLPLEACLLLWISLWSPTELGMPEYTLIKPICRIHLLHIWHSNFLSKVTNGITIICTTKLGTINWNLIYRIHCHSSTTPVLLCKFLRLKNCQNTLLELQTCIQVCKHT